MTEPVGTPPSIVAALRRLEHEAVEGGLPPGTRHRIAARLHEEAERRMAERAAPRRWLPALTFAAGAALVMVVVGSGMHGRAPAAEEVTSTPRMIGSWFVEGADCREAMDAGDTVLTGDCRLVSAMMSIETWNETRLHGAPDGVRVIRGAALFSVEKVAAGGTPVRVEVSHGAIEVLGTRFTVEQGADGGHVDLFEGRIRFVGDGEPVEVAPGQRLGWGDRAASPDAHLPGAPAHVPVVALAEPADASGERTTESTTEALGEPAIEPEAEPEPEAEAEPEPPASASAGPRRERSSGAAEAATLIERVNALRASGRYRAAADLLRRALRRRWDRRTAEVLSYELGRILERQLRDEAAACAHWRRHAERYAHGRYADAVARGLERSCDASTRAR